MYKVFLQICYGRHSLRKMRPRVVQIIHDITQTLDVPVGGVGLWVRWDCGSG